MDVMNIIDNLLNSSDEDTDEELIHFTPEVLTDNESELDQINYVEVIVNNTLILTQRLSRIRIKNYDELTKKYSDSEFIIHFCLTRTLAYKLIEEFKESYFYKNLKNTPGRETLSAEKHILTFLWFAGHEMTSYRAVADRFDVALNTLFNIISRVTDFLLGMAPRIVRLPNATKKDSIKKHFWLQKKFPGVIGALDGTHITIDRPTEDPDSYLNRKHNFLLQMQGLVNHERKFMSVFIGYPGSVHDARVLRESHLTVELEDLCDDGQYILADSAYPCIPQIMTPYWDNGRLTHAQKKFNTHLSSCRIIVEHAFGILKQHFRQLYHCKLRDVVRCIKFIHACVVLHNLTNDDELKFIEPAIYSSFVENNMVQEVILHDVDLTGNAIRDELCRQFAAERHM